MTHSIKITAASMLLAGAAIGSVCAASDCETLDPESAIANLVAEQAGGKVLKVEETIDAQGCAQLEVRILVDGTIKAITIPNGA